MDIAEQAKHKTGYRESTSKTWGRSKLISQFARKDRQTEGCETCANRFGEKATNISDESKKRRWIKPRRQSNQT